MQTKKLLLVRRLISAENIREAVKETHERVDHLLDEFESVPQQKEEAPIPEEQSPSVSLKFQDLLIFTV